MPRKRADAPESPAEPPSESELAALLGPACAALEKLVAGGKARTAEWRRYTKRSPWVLRVSEGKKPVIYVLPEQGALRATVLLGPRAVDAALAGRVAARLHEAIRTAKVYPEGRPVPVRVKRASDAALVEQLVAVKLKPEGHVPRRRTVR
jgi:hypothetical protein